MKLSIVVPVYNAEVYLRQCVDSVLAQEMDDFEVVLVDDGSTDGSGLICDRYAEEHANVICIHRENGGSVSARLVGIEAAKGDYIGFLDADDWIEPDYYARAIGCALENGCDLVCSGYTEAFSDCDSPAEPQVQSGLYEGAALEHLRKHVLYRDPYYNFGIFPSIWSKIVRRELLLEWQGSAPKRLTLGEDTAVTYPLIQNSCASLYVLDDNKGYHYRQSAGSMVHAYNPKLASQAATMLGYLYEAGFVADDEAKRQDFAMYLGMITKWVIGNEIRSCESCSEMTASLAAFRDASVIDQTLSNMDYRRFPLNVGILLRLFSARRYGLLIRASRWYAGRLRDRVNTGKEL